MRRLRAVLFAVLLSAVIVGGSTAIAAGDEDKPSSRTWTEVVSARTETTSLYEKADGTFRQRISSEPFRVETPTGWEDVDYTLERRADGSVGPRVSPSDVSLSGGGDQALTQQTLPTATLTTRWPAELPAPSLDGDTATYANVYPGVDLKMMTDAGGVKQVLVVKTAAAAANNDLKDIEISTDVSGDGKLEETKTGGLSITDQFGREVGTGSGALMWDSSGTAIGDDRKPLGDSAAEAIGERVDGPAQGDDVDGVPLDVDQDTVTLSPDAKALQGDHVSYPVYIDPQLSGRQDRWAMAFKEHPSSSFYKWTGDNGQGVGYQDYNGNSTKRLYWWFGISGIEDAKISGAELDIKMTWSSSCKATQTDLYRVASFGSDLSWNNQPRTSDFQSSVTDAAGYDGCYPNGRVEEYNITQAATSAAASGSTYLAFMLKANSETNPRGWKRMMANTWITIDYNTRPGNPHDYLIDKGLRCGQTLGAISSPIRFSAEATDPDGHHVKVNFHYWRLGLDDPDQQLSPEGYVDSGSRSTSPYATEMLDSKKKAYGGQYRLRARAYDEHDLASLETPECDFMVDPDAPLKPAIEPDASMEGIWQAGESRSFTITPRGNDYFKNDVASYGYSVNGEQGTVTSLTSDKTAKLTIKAKTVGLQNIRVWAQDKVKNASEAVTAVYETNEPIAQTVSKYSFDKTGSTSTKIPDEGTSADGLRDLLATSTNIFSLRGRTRDADDNLADDRMLAFIPGSTESASGAKPLSAERSFTMAAWLDPRLPAESSTADPASAPKVTPMTAVSFGKAKQRPLATLGINADRQYEMKVFNPSSNGYVTVHTTLRDDGQPGMRFVVGTYNRVTGELTIATPNSRPALESSFAPLNSAGTNYSPALSADMATGSLRLGSTDESAPVRWTGGIDDVLASQGWADQAGRQTLWAMAKNRSYECDNVTYASPVGVCAS